jgi:hypothetical protein
MRLSFAAALFGAALALVPSASAQSAPSLLTTVGTPLPYRIDLPRDWEVHRESRMSNTGLIYRLAAGNGDRAVALFTTDVMQSRKESPFVSEEQARRIVTDMLVSSDSALYGMMQVMRGEMAEQDEPLLDVVQEIRTLGGQRAAYMTARIAQGRKSQRFEMHITVQNGIMYILVFMGKLDDHAAHEPLFTRIRESLVFAPAPQ